MDQEKKEFAKAIIKEHLYDNTDGENFCQYCHNRVNHDHEKDCVVLKADAYLKRVKG